jgi:hypothetical protein
MARDGKGKLFIVDGPTAEHGRRAIQAYRQGQNLDLGRAAMTACLHGGAVVAIGAIVSSADVLVTCVDSA